jgi:hypothetical protein
MAIRREEKRRRQKYKLGETMIKVDTANEESTGLNKRKEGNK